MSIEYQSRETERPRINWGVSTTQNVVVTAFSGCKLGLPPEAPSIWYVGPFGGDWTEPMPPCRGENNSATIGARISNDQVPRTLILSSIWLVPPIFQVSTRPLVE